MPQRTRPRLASHDPTPVPLACAAASAALGAALAAKYLCDTLEAGSEVAILAPTFEQWERLETGLFTGKKLIYTRE